MNYRTLVIAGYGTIGTSIVRLGKKELGGFESVFIVDLDFTDKPTDVDWPVTFLNGDIEDPKFITRLCRTIEKPALLLNVATGTDNVNIRKIISGYDIAYLDSCASSLPDKTECRFSKYMPYTYTPISSRHPHWLCWGINPGLVEIIARKMIRDMGREGAFDVSIYENDQLFARWDKDAIAVGWSPKMLVEEVMLSPALTIQGGVAVEREHPGSSKITAFWNDRPVPSRIVGHEDIWNIGQLGDVVTARFIYGLHPSVMRVLEGDPGHALEAFRVPDESVPITGKERVAVQVKKIGTEQVRTGVWETDHAAAWKAYGINAVQYQTGKSLLLAIMLMQQTEYGRQPISACASALPIGSRQWGLIETFMDELGIRWTDAGTWNLHAE